MVSYLKVFMISILPIFELRGSIPIGIAMDLDPLAVFVISIFGSLIPSPLIYYLSNPIFKALRSTELFRSLVDWISKRTLRKGKNIKRYGFLGLLLFVATPLPGTGVWTGSLAASLLNLNFRSSFVAIIIGDIIAAVVLITISLFAM